MLLLTLGGSAFVYQGEEIGMVDGPGGDPPLDRFGRDGCRHPMQWTAGTGGFTSGTPWLPPVDPEIRNVEDLRDDPDSILALYRELVRVRRELDGPPERFDADAGVLSFRRGRHRIAINTTAEQRPLAAAGAPWLESVRGAVRVRAKGGELAPHAAVVTAVD